VRDPRAELRLLLDHGCQLDCCHDLIVKPRRERLDAHGSRTRWTNGRPERETSRSLERAASGRCIALERGDPASVDEPLAEASAVTPHRFGEFDEVWRIGVRVRLLTVLDGGSPLPVRVAVEPSPEMSCAVGIHDGRLKGSGGGSPSASYPPPTCAFPV
jgi:hypothetical protein